MTVDATTPRTKRQHLATLAIVATYEALNNIFLATDMFTYSGYIKANLLMMVLVTCAVLSVQHWRAPMRSNLGPLASFLFTFGALMTLRLIIPFYQEWTDGWVSQLPLETQSALLDPMKAEVPESILSPLDLGYSMLFGPVGEEFIYRFALLGSVAAFVRKPWALLISTLVFVSGHYWGHTFIGLGEIFLLGVALGVTYLTCGLGWAMLLHFLYNSFWTFQHSQLLYLLFTMLMPFSLWVFFTRLFRLRKIVFGS